MLHDGALDLVLDALKLAPEFLTKGGWFDTKISHFKDYQSLIWILQQLLNRVHFMKPDSTRMESNLARSRARIHQQVNKELEVSFDFFSIL